MAFSTRVGFVNPNDQEVLGPTGEQGTDHGQSVYVLRCGRCGHEYGANGSDIAGRRCPTCDGGRPGFDVNRADIILLPDAHERKARRNPPWTRDELILALDLYFENPMAGDTNPAVVELSSLLNRLWAGLQVGNEKLRSPGGVSMKLGNFQGLDPEYTANGRIGLPNGGRLEKEIWTEFSVDRDRLKAVAKAIRIALTEQPELALASMDGPEAEASEGAVLTRLHRYRERDRSLPEKRKAQARERDGKLVCEACDFDFSDAYGERGRNYIEVHHTKPLASLRPGEKTRLSDLALLCANCHRMVHAGTPWLSMEELRMLVSAART